MRRCFVKDVMSPIENCVVVKPKDTIKELRNQLRQKQHRAGIVISESNEKIVGIISVTNLHHAHSDDFVSDHWTTSVDTIPPDVVIARAEEIMSKKGYHQLIVANKNNEPIGMVWDYAVVAGCPDDDG